MLPEDFTEELFEVGKKGRKLQGENNISDGVEIQGNNVTSKYGYYGKAAAWDVGDVHMKGGAGQMNTIYSWGTLKEAGIILIWILFT